MQDYLVTERQKLILMAIVEEYVKTNEPVGSLVLSKREELNFSSATLRNDMAILEELGYLEKTHTSSGRIPSEKGYRLYVNEIMRRGKKDETLFPMIDEIFENPNVSQDEAIYKSMELVTQLTNYASIIHGRASTNARIKKLEYVALSGNYAIILMVTDKGQVESKRIMVPSTINPKEIKRVIQILDELLHNQLVSDIHHVINNAMLPDEIREYLEYRDHLVSACVEAFSEMLSDKYHFSGRYNILNQPEFKDVEKVRELFNAIERREILRVVNSDSLGITIKIGHENELKVMKDCTVVTVPYEGSDGSVGAITIFGPKRMEYSKVIPLLEYIAGNIKKIV